jgi:hypothetical protein
MKIIGLQGLADEIDAVLEPLLSRAATWRCLTSWWGLKLQKYQTKNEEVKHCDYKYLSNKQGLNMVKPNNKRCSSD